MVRETSIPGLLEIDLTVHGDKRGWFKESYQRAKLEDAGLPAWFNPVQSNVSYNAEIGVTRGIHGEPWDKYVSPALGRVFSAIVDLRAGDTFGRVETFELGPSKALFIPRGCANSFQTLDTDVVYTYLVNAHWSADAKYSHINLFDPALAIVWPIEREKCIVSNKDAAQPPLSAITPLT